MKKILLFASALAGLFLAGCQRENLEPVQAGQQVTFTIEAPAAMQTKAIADGQNVDQLVYEVWLTPELGNLSEVAKAQKLYQAVAPMVSDGTTNKAELTLDLVNDQKFTVLFWAQVAHTYDTDELTAVGYKDLDALKANDESLAAFYGVAYVDDCRNVKKDGTSASPEVILKRPFAQLNLCTLNTSTAYDVVMVESEVIVSNVPTVFNVNDHTAVDAYASVTFDMAAVPSDPATITVNNKTYQYAGMNYMFAGDNIHLEYNIKTKLNGESEAVVNNEISSVPLKENYRTNIVGNLLTSKTDFEIIVDADFNAPENVIGEEWTQTGDYTYAIKEGASAAALKEVLAHANAEAALAATKSEGPVVTIDLEGNVEWATEGGHGSSPLLPAESLISEVIINGNGKTFTATGAGVGSIRLANGGVLRFNNVNIVDESVSYAENAWEFTYLEFAGLLSFNGCTFNSGVQFQAEEGGSLVATFEGCHFITNEESVYAAWVSDGVTSFDGCTFEGTRGLKIHEAYGSEVTRVEVLGCEFGPISKKPGIALGDLNAETTIVIRNSKFVGCEGGMYETDTDVTTFEFVNENNEVHANPNAMVQNWIENAQAGETVNIPAGEYTFPTAAFEAGVTVKCAEGTVFTGATSLDIKGATVEGATFSNPTGNAVSSTINGSFKDCTFTGSNAVRYAYAGETCYFENCVFSGNTYGFHFDGGANEAYFKNCTFSGFNAFGAAVELVTFEGCTFKGNGKSGYNGANLWGSAKMIDTQFIFDGSTANEWIDCIGADKTYEFTGCTVNGGSAVNPDYISSRTVGAKIKIDGVTYTWAEGDYLLAENGDAVVTNATAFTAALAKDATKKIALAPGTYEGTFHVLKEKEITSVDAVNKAMIKGRVHVNSVNATFTNVNFDRNETNSNEPNNTASNALQYRAVVMIYGDQTHTIKFDGCNFYNNNGTHRSAITNVACDLIVDNCYFEGYSSSIYSQANLSVTNSTFKYTGGNNVILSINGCGANGGKVIFKNNNISGEKIFAMSQFLSTVGFGDGTYHFDVQGNTGAGFDYYFLNEYRVANKTFAEGSVTF